MTGKFLSLLIISAGINIISCSTKEENNNNSEPVKTDTARGVSPNDFNAIEKKLILDSLNIDLRTALATNYYSAGQLDKAAYHFLIIYEQDHKNFNALRNLGNIFYDNQNDDKAIQFYEKAIAIDPGNIDMNCDLATCYSRTNRPKKAIEILKGNIKLDYNHKQSHHNLSVILKQSGNIKEAEKEMNVYDSLFSASK